MGCGCGNSGKKNEYEVVYPDGRPKKVVDSKTLADIEVSRVRGASYTVRTK